MELYLQALLFGLFSALSLPVGALLGMVTKPGERTIAKWMGLGAGSLVYAVATQLYGKTLFKLLAASPEEFMDADTCDDHCNRLWMNLNLQVLTGFLGALAYRGINHVMPKCLARISAPRLAHIANKRSIDGKEDPEISFEEISETGSDDTEQSAEKGHPNVALSMWIGLFLDGIPESLMLGFMTNGREMTFSFITAIFVANFPEAFAGAAALHRQGMAPFKNLMLWSSLFFLTGTLAMVGSIVMPVDIPAHSWLEHLSDYITVTMQGFTGGAMLAMVATAMMPEAYHGAGSATGNLFVLGFGLSIIMDGMGARFGHPQEEIAPLPVGRNRTLVL